MTRRAAGRAVILILLGLCVSVALAWGQALSGAKHDFYLGTQSAAAVRRTTAVGARAGELSEALVERQFGWPFQAFAAYVYRSDFVGPRQHLPLLYEGIVFRDGSERFRIARGVAIPLRPLALGLTANSALIALLVAGAAWLRRRALLLLGRVTTRPLFHVNAAILCVVFGTGGNIAIAWLCALREQAVGTSLAATLSAILSGPGSLPAASVPAGNPIGVTRRLEDRPVRVIDDTGLLMLHQTMREVIRAGLPFQSFYWTSSGEPWFTRSTASTPESTWEDGLVLRTVTLPTGATRTDVVPVLPLWPGFLANSAFYGLVVWLPVIGRGAIRRHRRRRTGRCEACGYPFGAAAVCPECGRERSGSSDAPRGGRSEPLRVGIRN